MSDPKRTQGEYPGAAYVSSDFWFLSDGHGGAYVVRIPQGGSGPAQLQSLLEFVIDGDTLPTPFQLHTVSVVDSGTAVAIISTTVPHAEPPTVKTRDKDQHLFDIWGLKFSIPSPESTEINFHSSEKPSRLVPLFRKRGTHIPFHASYFPSVQSFLILSGSVYTSIDVPLPQEYVPAPDECMPTPRLGDIAEGSFDLNSSSSSTSLPPPYSWTQTNDSLTVAFALPGTVTKESIRVFFGKTTISLATGNPPLPQPFYNNAPLWDSIDSATSVWTWERPSESNGNSQPPKAGLLTLHLEKLNQGTRWSSLFAQGFEVAEVPETLDPSELAQIREMLDKYTAAVRDGGGGADLGHGVPSLAEGERDAAVDEAVGRRTLCTWIGLDENVPKLPADDVPMTVLSLPIPISNSEIELEKPFTLIAKSDIDGPLFTLGFLTNPDMSPTPTWTHTQTYSALSFVLASKQDTRFTYHYQHPYHQTSNGTASSNNDGIVLAFESGSRSSGSANVYTYRSSNRGDVQARQGVFQLQPGSGALVGVGVVHSKEGEPVLICLCEKEVTLCRAVF